MLGYHSVEDLRNTLTVQEYNEWLAYINLKMKRREKYEYYAAGIKALLLSKLTNKAVDPETQFLHFTETAVPDKQTQEERAKRLLLGSGSKNMNPVVGKLQQWAARREQSKKK